MDDGKDGGNGKTTRYEKILDNKFERIVGTSYLNWNLSDIFVGIKMEHITYKNKLFLDCYWHQCEWSCLVTLVSIIFVQNLWTKIKLI